MLRKIQEEISVCVDFHVKKYYVLFSLSALKPHFQEWKYVLHCRQESGRSLYFHAVSMLFHGDFYYERVFL